MTVQRFVSLALPESDEVPDVRIPFLESDAQKTRKYLLDSGYEIGDKKFLVLCPGAEYGEAKRWPAEYYAKVAEMKVKSGWVVIILGSEKDQQVAASINNMSGNKCIDLSGKTSLSQAVDTIALADCVVTNDSGLMHIAAALNRKMVAIYGSSDPDFTPPLNSKSRILSLAMTCSPCMQRECSLGHLKCLKDISPSNVLHEISILCQ